MKVNFQTAAAEAKRNRIKNTRINYKTYRSKKSTASSYMSMMSR